MEVKSNTKQGIQKNSRFLTIRLTVGEIEAVNAALCAAYVDYSTSGRWPDGYLSPEEQKTMAKRTRNAIKKIDSKLAAFMRLLPEERDTVLRFCSYIDDTE